MPKAINAPSFIQQIPAHPHAGNKASGYSSVRPLDNSPALAVRDARTAFQGARKLHPLRSQAQGPLHRADWQSSALMYRDLHGQAATPTKPRPGPAYLSDQPVQNRRQAQQSPSLPQQQKSGAATKARKAPALNGQRWQNPAAVGQPAHPGYLASSEPDPRYQAKSFIPRRVSTPLPAVTSPNVSSISRTRPSSPKQAKTDEKPARMLPERKDTATAEPEFSRSKVKRTIEFFESL